MKNILLSLLVLTSFFIKVDGQVGVGTNTPNSSANLDIDVSGLSTKKGMLLPRVMLQNNTDVTTIANPAVGLMVYNTQDNGTSPNAVEKNTFYFWNGVQWTNISSLTEVKRELLPQVFFIAEGNNNVTTPQYTYYKNENINVAPVVIKFDPSSVILNTGNNITLNTDNTLLINNSGLYEVSGFINYNPSILLSTVILTTTNVEFIIQISTDNGISWNNIAKTVGVWGEGTSLNNRTNNISPVIITANKNNLLRCLVFKTQGDNHRETTDPIDPVSNPAKATISAPTGLEYGKVLKILKLD
ncbi:hypothetical protein [Chryseobacterium sp.]|uniref:hypothetical protein n=1 Tax=Chryseobacterium sp. TaxID=1871047 RepID=UPI00388FCAED